MAQILNENQQEMKNRREFEVAYVGLKNGLHTMNFNIQKSFFELVEADATDYEDVNVDVTVHFDKHSDFFELKFEVDGTIVLPCDRCGDNFEMQLWDEFKLIVKLKETAGEQELTEAEDDGDIVFWPKSEAIMDLSEWIYEFVTLSMPMQRIHPETENGESTCNKESLQMLARMEEQALANEAAAKEASNNNIWKGLDAFKNNNNN